MGTYMMILLVAMTTFGLILLVFGIGLLLYSIWRYYRPETPQPDPDPAIAPNIPTDAPQQ